MKKWLMLTLLSIVLIACSNDESIETSSSEEVKQTTENELTEENAIKIAKNIHNSFVDTWMNMENVLTVNFDEENYGMFLPNQHYEQYTSRLHSFATDNFLDAEYTQMIKEMCFACDALPYSLSLDFADEHVVSITSDTAFSVKSHYPISLYYNESNITKSYVLEDGQQKIDDEQYEVLKQADGFTDYDEEYVEPTVNEQLHNMYAQGLALQESYYNVDTDNSMAEMADDKYAIAQQFKDYLRKFD